MKINFIEKRMKRTLDSKMKNLTEKEKSVFRTIGNAMLRNIKSLSGFLISLFFYYMLLERVGFEKTIVLLIALVILVISKKDKNKEDVF